MLDHFMLMQCCQELVAEVLAFASSMVLQGLQLLVVPRRVHLVVLVHCGTCQSYFHVMQFTCSLQGHSISLQSQALSPF